MSVILSENARKETMDKEFKRIFDELRKTSDSAEKVHKVMNNYQEHLDMMVETGLMDEHEARMDFFCKTNEVLAHVAAADDDEDEDEDNDAEDEQDDCDYEPTETVETIVDMFAEHKAVREAFNNLTQAMRDAGVDGSVRIDLANAIRRDDRS